VPYSNQNVEFTSNRGTNCMHRAVADGPNHSPGCFPHAEAPCSTKLWIEKGARGSSANSDISFRSSRLCASLRQSDPMVSGLRRVIKVNLVLTTS
jgi:hypothetical protein